LSAEWIIERPSVNNQIASLADFGNATLTNCTATIGSVTGGSSSFPAAEIVMYSTTAVGIPSVQLTDVSASSADGKGFTVNYLTSG
jgi:hypothetical protein